MDELEGGAQGRTYFVKLKETGVHYAMNSVKYFKQAYIERSEKEISEIKKLESKFTHIFGIFGQMIRALDFLHCKGVIHWDIKPANIFVMIDGYVRLGDFGLARDFEGDYYLKEERIIVYMAAEVLMFKMSSLRQRAHPRRQNRIRELPEEDRPVRNQKRHSQITTGIARKIKKRLIASKRLRR
ncbi:MAG: hypothetical protein EZS28_040599, partial [Streblomastix strix]